GSRPAPSSRPQHREPTARRDAAKRCVFPRPARVAQCDDASIEMTDDEYKQYLAALAARHVSAGQQGPKADDLLRREIARISTLSRLVEDARDHTHDTQPSNLVVNELAQSPVDSVKNAMETTGILDALDEAPTVTFGEFRRNAIPEEDFKILRHLGY